MTQEQLKNEAYDFIKNNLNKETKKELVNEILEDFYDLKEQLELANEILDNLSDCFYIDGYIQESNTLTTCLLKIRDILKENK